MIYIGEKTKEYIGVNNVNFIVGDFCEYAPEARYDIVFSLANHSTVDGRLVFNFEDYISKIFYHLNPGGILFFESHNVFGPGHGGAGDDGDMDKKVKIMGGYFKIEKYKMVRTFVPCHDVDKLFMVLRRRDCFKKENGVIFDLGKAVTNYEY